jgi:hypothetical protein
MGRLAALNKTTLRHKRIELMALPLSLSKSAMVLKSGAQSTPRATGREHQRSDSLRYYLRAKGLLQDLRFIEIRQTFAIAVAGYEKNRQRPAGGLNRFREVASVHFWHREIGDHEIDGRTGSDDLDRFSAARDRNDVISKRVEQPLRAPEDRLVVVDKQNLDRHTHVWTVAVRRLLFKMVRNRISCGQEHLNRGADAAAFRFVRRLRIA